MQYHRIPRLVDAFQWMGNKNEFDQWLVDTNYKDSPSRLYIGKDNEIYVHKKKSVTTKHRAYLGDFVVKSITGGYYVVCGELFSEILKEVEGEDSSNFVVSRADQHAHDGAT